MTNVVNKLCLQCHIILLLDNSLSVVSKCLNVDLN